jgi:hypothetical protein
VREREREREREKEKKRRKEGRKEMGPSPEVSKDGTVAQMDDSNPIWASVAKNLSLDLT